MDSLTIRVNRSTHGLLRELAEQTGETMTEIVDRSVREYQRQRFWADYQSAYAALQADPIAWADFQGEVESWDTASADGLEEGTDDAGPTEFGSVAG